jgi:hypothetical protein
MTDKVWINEITRKTGSIRKELGYVSDIVDAMKLLGLASGAAELVESIKAIAEFSHNIDDIAKQEFADQMRCSREATANVLSAAIAGITIATEEPQDD